MVGDRSHDVEGAAEHGIDTVVVGWGYGRADFDGPDRRRRAHPRLHRRRSARGARCLMSPTGRLRCLTPARHVHLLGQHLPVADGGEDVRPSDQRARPVGRGAGDQRRNRRLACGRPRRPPGQPRAARTRLPHRAPRRADRRRPSVRRPDRRAGPQPRPDASRRWVSTPDRIRMLRSFDPRSACPCARRRGSLLRRPRRLRRRLHGDRRRRCPACTSGWTSSSPAGNRELDGDERIEEARCARAWPSCCGRPGWPCSSW